MKRKKSFKKRIIFSFVVSILVAIIAMDAVSIYQLYNVTIMDGREVVSNIGESNVEKVNAVFGDVTHSAEVIYKDAIYGLQENPAALEDDAYREEFGKRMYAIMQDVAESTEGTVAVYLVYDQYASYSDETLYLKKDGNKFKQSEMIKVSDYDSSDQEHVGWYYETIASGKPTWIQPYYDEMVSSMIYTYTIPIYVNHSFVGLVGMDVDINYLRDIISKISAYNSGYGFLLSSDYDVIYHPEYEMGEKFEDLSQTTREQITSLHPNQYVMNTDIVMVNGEKKWITYRTLINGMIFGISVYEKEIILPVGVLLQRTIMITAVVLLFTVAMVVQLTLKLFRPLNELAFVAEKLGKGDMEVEIANYETEEFIKLADAFKTMRNRIKESLDYMSGLAYSDLMTGVNNKGAFERDSLGITENCQKSGESFAVIVADINNLKEINDIYGHTEGDELIKGVAYSLMSIFGKRNTYRVGGDEFCVLLRESNSVRIEQDIASFRHALSVYQEEHKELFHRPIVVAVGYGIFKNEEGRDFKSVYERADSSMYENKKRLKEAANNSNNY